jgi:hypothetical protein
MAGVTERCTWCDASVEPGDGFRVGEPAGERHAIFCRLEHVVPWVITGARWEAGARGEPPAGSAGDSTCAWCERELGEVQVLLVRHRGEHRVGDAFCGVDHLLEWAKAGGRWRR